MTRLELRQLAEDRIADAASLLAGGRWSGAYYLTGFAVACALKACVAKLTNQDDFPRERKFVEECYTHDLEKLVRSADIKSALNAALILSLDFRENWGVANDWRETSRYEQKTQTEAEELYAAITDNLHGVLPWIRLRW